MNRVLWRVAKLLFAVIVAGLCFTQLSVITSKLDTDPPFPVNSENRPKVLFTNDRSHHHDQDPLIERSITVPPPLQNGILTFSDVLLKKPQQFNDYHRRPNITHHIWPDRTTPNDDRILNQMAYLHPYNSTQKLKTILVYNGLRDGMREGQTSFKKLKCPVDRCVLTSIREKAATADLILWQEHLSKPAVARPPHQIWMVFLLESPYHTTSLSSWKNQMNWTATYRRDSSIVAPYERFTYFNTSVTQLPLAKNYADGKTKKVAWFVSNCGARNNRMGYAQELSKYIEVDIYGGCGTHSCPRSSKSDCYDMLSKTYKFYLAFENSNCKDYITEKFFVNGLQNDVVPIVMGAHPDDYKAAAPTHSYIHVDDFESPEHLAKYLHQLDQNDDEYNNYFRWKGTGDNINTYFWCRLCAMTHAASDPAYSHVYEDVENWWRGPQVCKERSGDLWPKWV